MGAAAAAAEGGQIINIALQEEVKSGLSWERRRGKELEQPHLASAV